MPQEFSVLLQLIMMGPQKKKNYVK